MVASRKKRIMEAVVQAVAARVMVVLVVVEPLVLMVVEAAMAVIIS